jgi:uncharacterized protein
LSLHHGARFCKLAWFCSAPLAGFYSAVDTLLLPILPHCVDDHGRLLLAPPRTGPQTQQLLRTAYKDIPAVVDAMRQYWMPTLFKTRS